MDMELLGNYFLTGYRSSNTACELYLLQNDENCFPNKFLIDDSRKMIEGMNLVFSPLEDKLPRLSEERFYFNLIFGEMPSLFDKNDSGEFWKIDNLKKWRRIHKLVGIEVKSAMKTLEKISLGKNPSKNDLARTYDLFDVISDECLSKAQKLNGPAY